MGTPSGEQVHLRFGEQAAVVTEVGASLRSYDVAGAAVLDGYAEDAIAGGGRGQVLAPWPNRLEEGKFEFAGRSAVAALDEPARGNAIHGLVRWLRWSIDESSVTSARLACSLAPQPAYPFALALRVEYSLSAAGLTVTTRAATAEDGPVPFGIGFHPYLLAWGDPVDGAFLELPAAERLLLDGAGLPIGSESVEGTPYDFRVPRPIGELRLDDCFASLARGRNGTAEAVLRSADGSRSVTLWAGPGFSHLMCYTGDTLGDPAARRRAVAIEPMSCPPNSLRSGDGLVVLEPGAEWSASWGVRTGAQQG